MDPARWQRVQALFHEAADLPAGGKRAFLDAACADDPALVSDVLILLEEDARHTSLLDRDVAHVAHDVLGQAGAPAHAGKQIGPYGLRELLGEGGMGVVYLAEREDLGSTVAVKILRDAWLSPARRERFAAEQRMLAQLNHASIARLYDADTLPDGTPWFAMEYVEGVPLIEYCRKRASSIPERLHLLRSVCEAVEYAHAHAVIHRDLKPSNILVKNDGSVRLLDFGIAKQLDGLDAAVDLTRTGLRLMTPAYAAPEQIQGGRVGVQTDVYALGVILYELLAGRLPFDLSNRTPAEAEAVIVRQEPEKPSMSPARVAPAGKASWADLDVLCLTAMHKDAQRRYRSVEAFMRDIDHYLNGEPLESRPDTLHYRLGKFVARNRRPVSVAAFVFVAVVALVLFFTLRLASARNTALAEAARAHRVQRFMEKLFEGGDKAAGPADNLRVVTLLDRGVQEAQTLNAEPSVQAELYQTLGGIYQKLGKFDRADTLLRFALDRRRTLLGPDHPDVAASLVALGLLRVDQAQLEQAEQLVREGLEKARRKLPPSHPAVAKATLALGQVLEARGAYDKSIAVLEQAVRLQPQDPPTPELAAALAELANAHFYAGHYDTSDSLNHRVMPMHRRLYGERHPLVAQDLTNLGATQFERGRYTDAERFYRQGLEITQSYYGKNHYETASGLTMLGRALVFENRYDEAVELLQQSLAIQESVNGPVHPRVASALNELASVALQRGDLDEAEARFRRMTGIYRAVYGDRHYLLAIATSNLASVYMERKQYARAEQLYRDALARSIDALSAGHLQTGITRIKLGRALLRQQRYQEAEGQTLAGYRILMKQTSPSVSFLRAARKDLTAIYQALNQPEKAREFAGSDR